METIRMKCQVCGKNLGYSEYEKNARPTKCEACKKAGRRNSRRAAWEVLTAHFVGNTTYGVTHEKEIVKAAWEVGSGWAGETFVMISGGRHMVRYWHRSSPGNPGTRR